MKSMAELEAIRQRTLQRINLRKEDDSENIRVVVGMATCGIAAGARPVMLLLVISDANCPQERSTVRLSSRTIRVLRPPSETRRLMISS